MVADLEGGGGHTKVLVITVGLARLLPGGLLELGVLLARQLRLARLAIVLSCRALERSQK